MVASPFLHDAVKSLLVYSPKEAIEAIYKGLEKEKKKIPNWCEVLKVEKADQERLGLDTRVDAFYCITAKSRDKYTPIKTFSVFFEIKTGRFREEWVYQIEKILDRRNRKRITRQRWEGQHPIFVLIAPRQELTAFKDYVYLRYKEDKRYRRLNLVSKIPIDYLVPLAVAKQKEWIEEVLHDCSH